MTVDDYIDVEKDDFTKYDTRDDDLDKLKADIEIRLRDTEPEFDELCTFIALCRRFGYDDIADYQEKARDEWIMLEVKQHREAAEESANPYAYRGLPWSDYH